MTRADRIAAALERWRIETEPGADMPSMPSVKAAGEALAALLRKSQPEPVYTDDTPLMLKYREAAEPAPVVEGDEPEYRAKVSVPEIIAMHEELIALRAALATAEEAKAKAVRSVAKRACEATAEWAMEDPSVLSPEWIESGKAGQQMNAIIDGCVAAEEEAIRARAGRNDD